MGRLIDQWIAEELPKIQIMLQPPGNMGDPGIDQGNGVRTFGMPSAPAPQSPQSPQTFGPPEPEGNVLPPNWQSQIPRSPAAQRFAEQHGGGRPQPRTFGGEGGEPVNAAGTFETPEQRRPTMKQEDVSTAQDLFAAAPDETSRGIDIVEQQLGGPEGLDKAYEQATGRPPSPNLSRQQKGELLMEFGLRVLAHNSNGQGDSLGAIGRAGAETLGSYRGMKKENETRVEDERQRKLKNDLLEAQIEAAKVGRTQIKADRDGNLRVVDMRAGTSRVVVDEEGNPVKTNGEGADDLVFNVQRSAYEGAFCEGLEGDALEECKKSALLFSKGGDIAELAFPEIRRQKRVDELMKFYADPDNSGVRIRLPSGETKRWREMDDTEQREAVLSYVDRFDTQLTSMGTGPRSAAPARTNNWGLTQQQLDSFPEGKRATLPNGVILSRRNGKVVQIDEQGNEIE